MSCAKLARGSVQKDVNVSGGIHLNTMRKPRMITMPSQNDGIASPAIEKIRTA